MIEIEELVSNFFDQQFTPFTRYIESLSEQDMRKAYGMKLVRKVQSLDRFNRSNSGIQTSVDMSNFDEENIFENEAFAHQVQ